MQSKEKHYIESPSPLALERPNVFPPHVLAGVTLRNEHLFPQTGLSLLPAQILTEDEVLRHRRYFADTIGVNAHSLKFQRQVHGTTVRVVTAQSATEESDGLATQERDVVLCVGMADCAGILLYDAQNEAVAALHSGWGGTKDNIAAAGIETMRCAFGTRAEDILAYLAPCASGERYEVRWDVARYFPSSALRQINHDRWLLDIRTRIVEQLIECGVPERHIERSEGCSIGNVRYHSHRRDGARAGRMIAFIGLRSRE